MKITPDALTTNQKTILCHADLPYHERADANHDFLTRIGFEAFRIAQLGLKSSGLLDADYSLTHRGQELFKELMGDKPARYCICVLDEQGAILHRDRDCPVHGDVDETAKELVMENKALSKPTEAEQTALGERILDSQVVPQVCTDPQCPCHDLANPKQKRSS